MRGPTRLRAPRSPPVGRGTAMAADRHRLSAGVVVLVAVVLPLLAVVATPTPAQAATVVCALYCDTRDPSLARQETFPVPERNQNGRRIVLHVSDTDGMAWGGIDAGGTGDSIWLDRSWDGGANWEGLLGKASIPSTWTGTRTLMYNLYDPAQHRRGVVRACGDAQGVACTEWVHLSICSASCDGTPGGNGTGDNRPVPGTTLNNRGITLHFDNQAMAWAAIANGTAGDEVWLEPSWDAGVSWPGGSSLGRTSITTGSTGVRTTKVNTHDPSRLLYGGAVRACGCAVGG